MRKFNYNRDTNVITGEVTRKRVEDDRCYVDIDFRATILRGTVTAPGSATVLLPSGSTVQSCSHSRQWT